MALPHYITETQTLRRIANHSKCRLRFTAHALKEMKKDGWTAHDVQLALINGQVVLHEQKQDLLWRVVGTDIDGGRMTMIVAVYELTIEIKVVTAF
jgi:Domain of unknown function (DUF4258)